MVGSFHDPHDWLLRMVGSFHDTHDLPVHTAGNFPDSHDWLPPTEGSFHCIPEMSDISIPTLKLLLDATISN